MLDFLRRRDEFLRFIVHHARDLPTFENAASQPWHHVYLELPKFELARRGCSVPPLDEAIWNSCFERWRERRDCGDFLMNGALRALLQYPDSPLWTPAIETQLERAIVGWSYWVDEPGEEKSCFFSENHQILYHAAELLAGQKFPIRVFANGQTGEWHAQHAATRIERWLDWRARFDFSEWNSLYYNSDLVALANLADFAESPAIRARSRDLISLLLFHVAVNSSKGVFAGTSGRAYQSQITHPAQTAMGAITYLMWGLGDYGATLSKGAVTLALSDYQPPAVLGAIARDNPDELENCERHGVNVEDAAQWNLRPDELEDFPFFAQSAHHRAVVEAARVAIPRKHGNMDFGVQLALDYYRDCEGRGESYDADPCPHALTQADIYCFRTPDFALSCAQSYRPGKPGYQQHIWQATLGERALVFTTNPSSVADGRPDYWAGNAVLPRALAHRNLLICLYRTLPQTQLGMPPLPHLLASHAYFPRAEFDEVCERDGWLFARKDDGYLALHSRLPTVWKSDNDLFAQGARNAWICELGRQIWSGSFAEFVARFDDAAVEGDEAELRFDSPSLGRVEAGWDSPFFVNGKEISTGDYPRFDNPYCRAEFGETAFSINCGESKTVLDLG